VVFNIDPAEIGVIMLDPSEHLQVGSEVQRTKRVLDVPVGDGLLGRGGRSSGGTALWAGGLYSHRLPVERPLPRMDRAPVVVPLQTGIKLSTR